MINGLIKNYSSLGNALLCVIAGFMLVASLQANSYIKGNDPMYDICSHRQSVTAVTDIKQECVSHVGIR